MLSKQEIRLITLHEFKLGHNAAEATRNIIKAWGDEAVSKRTTRRWFERFRAGNTSLEDEDGRGRPSEVDDVQLKSMIEADPRKTTREVANDINFNHTTVLRHLHKIGKVKKIDKWVPHELTENQKNLRYEICSRLLLRNKTAPFLDRIVTCDEKWLLYDNRRRSAQWLNHDECPRQFPKPMSHPKKIMVSVWWSASGLIHHSFLKIGETITAERYVREIDEMHEKLRQKQPALVNRRGPILLHDNARPHIANITREKLHDLGYETLDHAPYSPDLAPTDFYLFKQLELFMRGKRFQNEEDVKNAFLDFVASRSPEFYAVGINMLIPHWQKCVDSKGLYFD